MAAFVFTDAYFSVTGTDLSAYVRSVTVNYQAELQDSTTMGDSTRERLGGLKDWSVDVEFNQDFASSAVDDTLWPLVGTTFVVAVRPTSSAKGATNPEYTGTGILESYPPLGGSVGDLATASITIQAAGDLSRATS
jgi:hypothetical protein